MLRKVLTLVLIVSLVFVLTSCASSDVADEDQVDSDEEAAETAEGVSEDLSELSDSLEGVSESLG